MALTSAKPPIASSYSELASYSQDSDLSISWWIRVRFWQGIMPLSRIVTRTNDRQTCRPFDWITFKKQTHSPGHIPHMYTRAHICAQPLSRYFAWQLHELRNKCQNQA